jgi:2-desacetyl-2-hydroxyethyl bacteriochlorophyllide A dehydrogenase
MTDLMTAYRITGPLQLEAQRVPIPTIKADEVLVRVAATGICGTDIELYDNSMPYIREGLTLLPLTPGHEWSGTVERVGDDVIAFVPGDRVVGDISIGCGGCTRCLHGDYHLCSHRSEIGVIGRDGGFADYLSTPARHLYRIPDSLSLVDASFAEPVATVVAAIRKTGLEPGETVYIFGDGTIGLLAAQVAAACGAGNVIVVSLTEKRRNFVETLGLQCVHPADVQPMKADMVVEATGNPVAMADAVKCVRPGGRISALSITGTNPIGIDLDYVVTRAISIIGNLASPNAFGPALQLMAAGEIDVNSLRTHTFPFDECVEAFDFVRTDRSGERIKTTVIMQ